MDSAAKDKMQPTIPPGPEWPEQERAEQLARGAALKWASGIFYRPEQLARLGQYRSREVQRTCSLEARIKSVVQSYLEGVKTGVRQLAWALEAMQGAREALSQAHGLLRGMAEAAQTLEPVREQVVQHKQLWALSQLLPRLRAGKFAAVLGLSPPTASHQTPSLIEGLGHQLRPRAVSSPPCLVPAAVAHTQTLIDAQRLLEAYVSLRELEQLQEETWAPLGGLELPVFEGLGPLAEALGQAVEAAAGAAGRLAREDPALLVAAVRVAEVDAGRTTSLEQAPRDWRQRCLRALQEGLERIHFGTLPQPGPGALAEWLEALRVALPAELATAEALVAPCCPPHYKVVQLWAHTLHSSLRRCLQQLLERPELGAADTFTLLQWALHVYLGPEMMGSLELGPEADVSHLEPLLTLENVEQLEATFVAKVQASVTQWLQKVLDGEAAEWGREQEPDTDPSGFYHSPMPAIVLQILEENIRVASMVSESLQQRVHDMALSELSAFLRSFSDALIRFSRDHLRGEAMVPHYVPYLLATLNHQSALSSSLSVLQPDWVAPGALAPVEAALDELQRRICRLVLEALLLELQPLFAALPSRQWLSSPELLEGVCERTARFCQDFRHVRNPAVQLLLAEAERTVVLQYLRALMQGRLVCRGADERTQAAERLRQDAAQLRELFLGLGLEESVQCAPVLLALRELLNLRDPTLLGLEVAGLRQQFPDVSEEHVSALLDLRGDVSREQRLAALSSLQVGPQPSPPTEVNSVGNWSDLAGCDPQNRMVLDSGAQVYEQTPPSPPASPSSLGRRLKPSDRNGTALYPWSQSLALPLAVSVPSALRPRPELQPFSKLHLGHQGHMRRSESTYTINSAGRQGSGTQGRATPGRGRSPGGGTLRSAASLPHIAKTRKDAGRGASKSPCMLVALRPTNMDYERDKFFQSQYTYNPQFEYQEPMPTAVLEKYCEASGQFIHQAVGIIEAVLEKFGTYEHFEAATGGQLLTKCQIWSIVRKYMQKEGCVGEVVVQLSEDLLSQAVMMVENSRPTLAINLTGARQYWLEGMLRHEIGTHYLRGVNNARQPWHSAEGRLQYGLRPANPTEEGLASLHSVLFRKQPFLWRAALLYYTIHRAARMSFRQLFQDLARYVQDADVRWEYCVRAKRGQTDTSLPGCFSKDQVYLDGIVRILRHRQTIDFPLLTSLGKVSYEDVDHLRPHGVLDNTRVPHFMQDLARYRQQLEHIMATNRLDEAELGRLLPD
ncbi:Exocyst complex component 3-like protein [Camelus dromedarius]|uniref:Exocyst complex component 3-like protein n=1 Tax=Camelus dromedarius TaxID=9838 RepID=A0A5N4DT05_CAMDR|nr:Exocyst complex component 3-like protein [Camelus dromedarius]